MKFRSSIIAILSFIIIYGILITQFDYSTDNYSDMIVATTFFFALFAGFFISRQNTRYSNVSDINAVTAGHYSYIYRVSGLVPRIQKEVREIIRDHYKKIMDNGDWAYHFVNPSDTITRMTKAISSLKKKEAEVPAVGACWGFMYEVVSDLQNLRKKGVGALNRRLTILHWIIIYTLGILVVVSFSLVPTTSIFEEILQIIFAAAVFVLIVLLHKLDSLTMFGDNVARDTAMDIFWIIDEEDKKLLKK